MDETQPRRAAAFAVLAGGLAAQIAHVVASLGQLLGVLFAPTAHAAASALVGASILGWLVAAGVLVTALRHALRPGTVPSVALGVSALGIALVSYGVSFGLGAASSMCLRDRLDVWSSDGITAGEALTEYTYASSGASMAGGLLSIAFVAIAMGWLARPEGVASSPRT